jgi:hypothetical protein
MRANYFTVSSRYERNESQICFESIPSHVIFDNDTMELINAEI